MDGDEYESWSLDWESLKSTLASISSLLDDIDDPFRFPCHSWLNPS